MGCIKPFLCKVIWSFHHLHQVNIIEKTIKNWRNWQHWQHWHQLRDRHIPFSTSTSTSTSASDLSLSLSFNLYLSFGLFYFDLVRLNFLKSSKSFLLSLGGHLWFLASPSLQHPSNCFQAQSKINLSGKLKVDMTID